MEKFCKETRRHYSLLHVYECPISLIRAAVELSEGDATVENLHPSRTAEWFPLEMQLFPGNDGRACGDSSRSVGALLRWAKSLAGRGLQFFYARGGKQLGGSDAKDHVKEESSHRRRTPGVADG